MNRDSHCRMLRYRQETGHQPPFISWNRIGRLALLLALCLSGLSGNRADAVEATTREEAIASFPITAPVQTVEEGFFLMGTARSGDTTFSLDLQYDDTEQPQRRIWLNRHSTRWRCHSECRGRSALSIGANGRASAQCAC